MRFPKWRRNKLRPGSHALNAKSPRSPRRRGRFVVEELEPRRLLSVNVTVAHYNSQNTGVNPNETILTPSNVNTSTFGKLYSTTVDGQVYAETLEATGVTITNGSNTTAGAAGVHDVVYVATENDSLYAIDAHSGAILWYRPFANVNNPTGDVNNTLGATAITPLSTNEVESTDISPSIGITGTPVIDTTTNTIYVVTQTAELVGGQYNFVYRLHAISLSDGTDQVAPFMIGDNNNAGNTTPVYVYGTGYNYGTGDDGIVDPYNGTGKSVVQFNALREGQRAGLSLVNGTIYVEFAAHGLVDPYHGWIVTFNVSNLQSQGLVLSGVLCTSPNDGRGGIWAGATGLAFEPDGSAFYFTTGNGNGAGAPVMNAQGFPTDANYSDSIVKAELDPTTSPSNQGPNGWGIKIVDYFIPYNVVALDQTDTDVGSGGVTLLPPAAGIPGHPNLLIAGGKTGVLYLLDRDDLGHFNQYSDAALNSVPNGQGETTPPPIVDGLFSSASYYNGELYVVAGYGGPVEAYDINSNGLLTFVSSTSQGNFGYIPGSPAISADGTNNAILWVSDRTNNELHALDPANLSIEYWNSSQAAAGADSIGTASKYDMPTVANGEVFIGTNTSLIAFGLKAMATAAPTAPVLTAATTLSNAAIGLTWTDSTTTPNTATDYLIEYSTDGVNFTQVATAAAGSTAITIAGLNSATTYYFQLIGVNPFGNSSPSNVLSTATTGAASSIYFATGFGSAASSLIQLNGSAKIANNALVLVNNQQNQTGSAWYNTQQNITQFSTSFQFSLTGTWPLANGLTFAIQNDLATALGVGGAGLGYGDGSSSGTGGIPSSLAIKFDVYNTAYTGTTGLYTNGQYPAGGNAIELTNDGINLRSYDTMQVNMTYNGTVLAVTLTDLTTNKTETQNYTVNIPALVGGNTAWVGFTAADGIDTILPQVFNWTYSASSGGGVVTSPSAPSGLSSGAVTQTSASLSWIANATNQTGYYLDRATNSTFTQNLLTQTLPAAGTTFTDTDGLVAGTTYYYQLRAFNSAGSSADSNFVKVILPAAVAAPTTAPTGFTAAAGVTSAALSWNTITGATSYTVSYGTTSGGPYTTVLPGITATTDTITGLTGGTPYFFIVTAVNSGGSGPNSTEAAATPAVPLPAAPTGLTATPANGSVMLAWVAPANATGYNVQRSLSTGGPYTIIAPDITSTTYIDTPLTNGVTYYYVVSAIDATGAGPNSAEVNATPSSAVTTVNYPNGFAAAASALTFNGKAHVSGSTLILTDNNPSETASVYTTAQQNIASFNTQFNFEITGSWPLGNGFTFVIQNSALNALGQGGSGLGYGASSTGNVGGIPNSVAIKFGVFGSQGEGNDSTGLYINGAAPTSAGSIDMTSTGFNLRSYDPLQANITYNGTTLTVTLTDLLTKATATQNYTVNIPSIVGGNTAWVGFTASDGSLTSSQNLSAWTYTVTAAAPTVPPIPTGVVATAGNGQVTLNWSASAGASSYTVAYSTTNGGPYTTVLPGITSATDTITGLTNSTPYYFVVSAVNANGSSTNSAQATATPAAGVSAPAAPTNLTATAGNAQVALTWTASAGATSYNVGYSTTSGGPYTFINGITATTDTVTGLTNGTPYFFVVQAVNSGGSSTNATQATATPTLPAATPAAPTGLTATPTGGQVALTWTASTGATSYNVLYGMNAGGPYPNVAGVTTTSDTITGLTNGTTYYFVVQAVNAGGASANSTQTSAAPTAAATTLNYSSGFASAGSSLKLNGNAKITSGNLVLTDNNSSETSSVYSTTQQNIGSFSTTFGFQITGSWPLGNGFTFVIQNSAVNAIGVGGSGLGYGAPSSGNAGGIPNSVAIKFSFFGSQGEGNDSTGLYVNGAAPTSAGSIDMTNTNFNLRSYDASQAAITYNGTTLTVTLTDLVTKGTTTQSYTVNIPSVIGSSTAWVGFTAADGSLTSSQIVSAWTFSSTASGSAPAAPTGVTATPGNGQVTLNWAASSGATSYNVKYATTSGGPYTTLNGFTAATAAITGLTNNTPYYFVVSAVGAGNESANSTEISSTPTPPVTAPAAPTGLTATAGNGQATLNWTAATGATSYSVAYATTTGGPYTTILTGITATTTPVTALTNGTPYYFVVSAVNSGGTSPNSNEATATPVAGVSAPAAPTGLIATAGNGQIALTWTASSGAATYNVKYSTTNGGPYTTILNGITAATDTITGLTNGTPYYFVVSAVNTGGESANSTQATATPAVPVAPPAAPTGLTAAATSGQVALTWNSSTGATSYNVLYGTTSGGPYPNVANVTTASTTITGLTNGTTYYFVVEAVNSGGPSANSTQATGAPSASATTLNYPTGFASAGAALTLNGNAKLTSGNLVLTDNNVSETSSAYATAQQNIAAFSTTFNFQITGTWPLSNGFTFVIQNSALNAIGVGGSGLGYGAPSTGNAGGIPNSVAVKFSFFGSQGEGNDSTGLYIDGAAPTSAGSIDMTNTGFNLRSYDPSQAAITYNGTTLTVTLTDLVTMATATQTYTVNIPSIVGGNTAWVGFTAADGSLTALQEISAWTFTTSSSGSAPAAPTSVTATPGNGAVTLNWASSTGATSYNVKYATTSGGPYTTLSGITATTDTITGLTNGTPYFFVVSAVSAGNESANSTETTATPVLAVTAPAAPTGLFAIAGNAQVTLSWTGSTGATSYNVKYGTATGGPYTIIVNGITGTGTTISGLTNNTPYYFVVSAVNSGGESANSSESTATPTAPVSAPASPTGLTATAGNAQVTLNWTASTGATSYNVKYGTTTGGPYTTVLNGVTATTDTITGLANGTPYFFVVSAVNSGGESANSTQSAATPALPVAAPAAPTGLTATAANSQVALSWTASTGATSYTVKYGTTSGGPYGTSITAISGTTTTVTGLTNGTTYYFVVDAVNSGGSSGDSTPASAAPSGSSTTLTYNGFTGASSSLKLNGNAKISGSNLVLTDNNPSETSSVYALTQQNIAAFSTTFNFQITGSWPLGNGFTFVIQNSAVNALGTGGSGLGYGAPSTGNVGGIPNSVAVKFSFFGSQGEGNDSTGLYINGAAPTSAGSIDMSNSNFNLRSYDNSQATITYNGTTLTVTLTDLVTKGTTTQTYTVNIPSVIGSSTAWVGFTASDGSLTASQIVSAWTYTVMTAPPAVPAVPTGLTAAAGNAQAVLNWSASTGATSYTVSYGTTSGGPYTQVLTGITATTDTITGLTNGTPYYFVVSAVNANGAGSNSTQASATPAAAPTIPAAPTGLVATAGSGQVALNWNAATGATSYTVAYGTTSGGPYTAMVSGITATTDTVTGLTTGTTYYFVVSAVNSAGQSPNSTPASAAPTAAATTLNYAGGFASAAASLKFNGSAHITGTNLVLTDNNNSETSSVYALTQQGIGAFNTTFDFQITGSWPLGNGFTFVIQNSALNAIGTGGSGLGYGAPSTGNAGGIPNSVAVKFSFFGSQGEGNDSTGLYINGAAPTSAGSIDMTNSGFNLRSYDASQASITYDGATLTVTLTDLVTKATSTQTYSVNIPAIVGGSTAWVGFTASDGSLTSSQIVSSWTYTAMTVTTNPPAAPTGLTAAAGNAQAVLNWSASSGATSYTVSYSAANGGPYTIFQTGLTGTTATVTGLTNNTPYYFVVSAVNTGGASSYSAQATATPTAAAITAPAAPTGLSASAGNGQVSLNWTASTGAVTYNVKYGTTTGGPYPNELSGITGATYTVPNLTNGTTYYFVVSAVNTGGESANSSQTTAAPTASLTPANFATGFTGDSSQITFNGTGSARINGSALYLTDDNRSERGSAWLDTPVNITSFSTTFDFVIDGSWPLGCGFTFAIQDVGLSALGAGGSGLGYGAATTGATGGIPDSMAIKFNTFSSEGQGTDSTGLYTDGAAPAILNSIDMSSSGFNLRSYDVSSCTLTYDGTTLTETLTDLTTKATFTQTYTVNIPAIVGSSTAYIGFTGGDGDETSNQFINNWVYTTTPPTAPVAPTGVSATVANNQVTLNWNASVGASAYTVSYGTTSGGPYTQVLTGLTATTDTITGLTNGTPYYFVVSAANSFGGSGNSAEVSATPALSAPATPSGLTAAPGDKQVVLYWTAPTGGAVSYTVSYGTASGQYTTTIPGITATTYTVTGLTDGTAYYFTVAAVNASGSSTNAVEAAATPSLSGPPTSLNFATGFAAQSNLTLNGSAVVNGTQLELINNNGFEVASVYDTTPQNIAGFSTEFEFQITGTWPIANGFTFVIQDAGLSAIGQGGGGLGYGASTSAGTGGIPDSVAVKFDIFSTEGEGTDSTGLYTDGAAPTINNSIDLSNSGFNLRSYDASTCQLSYDGATLTETLTDLVTKATVTETYLVNIPQIVGGNTAYIGFTAGDGSEVSLTNVLNWTYASGSSAPAAPTNVIATGGGGQIATNWAAVAGAFNYSIAYGNTNGGPYPTVISGILGTSSTITGLTGGQTYYLIVTAFNLFGQSIGSAQVTVTA